MYIPTFAPVRRLSLLAALAFASLASAVPEPFRTPVSYDQADQRASELLARMSTAQKLQLISGHNRFFIKGFPELGIPELYLADATGGVHIRTQLSNQLPRSTAFPSPITLASTWDPELAYRYAYSIGEECRAGGIAVLLGPGMNIYRQSQCGRNFEYFGEDPFLAARLIERYVRGVLDTGTMPTIKHLMANNTEFHRRTSNSIMDERTQHEIYLPAFKAGIDAGAMAVMTAYNQLNGEYCGQSYYVITQLLRGTLGYKGMVMTDWNSVTDPEKLISSGQDLEMPGNNLIAQHAARLLAEGKVSIGDIDRMARSIMRACIAMGLYDRPLRDDKYLETFAAHEQVALETARTGTVLLKNNGVLPLPAEGAGKILVTGLFLDQIPLGGGAAAVDGYNNVTLRQALQAAYGDRVEFVAEPSDAQLKAAAAVFVNTGTIDSEAWDRPFALPADEETKVVRAVAANPRTVVLVNSGSGIQMTGWVDRAAAVVYAWYPGQIGNRALAEILTGDVNPSGRLPITIERRFEDSPAYGYMPPGSEFYSGWKWDNDFTRPVNSITYHEGVFVGYRWYEKKKIEPLFPFGFGLSYTTFQIEAPRASAATLKPDGSITVVCTVRNTGKMAGAETVQVYVRPLNAPIERPEKELKGFAKVKLAPGESREVSIALDSRAFAFWDPAERGWRVAPGTFQLLVGSASNRIAGHAEVTIE